MRKLFLTVMALALAAAAAPAEAQLRPFTIGIQGGPSLARGGLSTDAGTGYNVQFSLGITPSILPVGVRGDLLWQEFSDDDGGRFREIGGLANAILAVPLPLLRPYAIGGVGMIRHSSPEEEHAGHAHEGENETRFGWNAGAGIQLGFLGLGAVLEARYLDGGEGHQSIPISVGIRF